MSEEVSVRINAGLGGSNFWMDTHIVESREENPAPTSIDGVRLSIGGLIVLDYLRLGVATLIPLVVPANSISFFARRRRTDPARLNSLKNGATPPVIDVYHMILISNAVTQYWTIADPVRDALTEDFDTEPNPLLELTNELLVFTFDPADISEISDETTKQQGKRPFTAAVSASPPPAQRGRARGRGRGRGQPQGRAR